MIKPEQVYETRRIFTEQLIAQFISTCEENLEDSKSWAIGRHACIYAVGSAGRQELTTHSDLDVFLLDTTARHDSYAHRMQGTVLKAVVIRSLKKLKLADPSDGGAFLQLHTVKELVTQIGRQTDDPQNTFTARMLLLLESHPLIGKKSYSRALERVLTAYWEHYDGHEKEYIPILFINDIVRYWRMLLLNYVGMTLRHVEEHKKDIDRNRRLRSYKLRFSRCLTCYSALAYLLTFEKPGIGLEEVKEMVTLCPHERLRRVGERTRDRKAKQIVNDLLSRYASFLETVDQSKEILLKEFDGPRKKKHYEEGDAFGAQMAQLMLNLGHRAPDLFRFMIV